MSMDQSCFQLHMISKGFCSNEQYHNWCIRLTANRLVHKYYMDAVASHRGLHIYIAILQCCTCRCRLTCMTSILYDSKLQYPQEQLVQSQRAWGLQHRMLGHALQAAQGVNSMENSMLFICSTFAEFKSCRCQCWAVPVTALGSTYQITWDCSCTCQ